MCASASNRTGPAPNSSRSISRKTDRIAAICSPEKVANTGDDPSLASHAASGLGASHWCTTL